jgi:starch synthase
VNKLETSTLTSLSRFKISDEHLVTDVAVKDSITKAYREGRTFEFSPDNFIIERIAAGDPPELFRERFFEITNQVFEKRSENQAALKDKLTGDTRLFIKIINAIATFHRAAAQCQNKLIQSRRIVIVQELPGRATIHHISKETIVLAHVGQGPIAKEIPTIYLGLKIFETLNDWKGRQNPDLFKAFTLLLDIEERAIETGFSHTTIYPAETSILLSKLLDSIIEYTGRIEERYREDIQLVPAAIFTEEKRNEIIEKLNARIPSDIMNFDYDKNLEALVELENYARAYKKNGDQKSLREIIKLLVAASGHDIHEIRNRANMILDRVFSPKEYDSPLATKFINVRINSQYRFKFHLADPQEKGLYYLRVYKNNRGEKFNFENKIIVDEIPLEKDENGLFTAQYFFSEYGHYDYSVIFRKEDSFLWINENGSSGRVNVLPDLRGEIILEIFVDIHGHTRIYWRDNDGHPGLVYNEHGEIIRLGNLSDITHHLEDLKSRYFITAVYLLGVQKRGNNREDWAPEATSPSPFSPMSLTEIEPSLGGEEELKKLIKKAHSLDIKVIVDIVPHLNRKSDELPDEYVVLTYDSSGNLVQRASTDGRYGSWNDGKLLNYRMFEIWEWLSDSIDKLIDKFDIDGIRFDSAHALPIMMKRNNYPYVYSKKRSDYEMLCGNIIVNDREYGHFITTSFYDCECREKIAVPIHYFLMQNIERKLHQKGKSFFINIAECFWGHEKYLTRTGLVPYNSALFKICENITHGLTDVREIYHIYDNYFPSVMPEGTELLGILGNHDERRALNTFGHRGLRAAVALTSFMNNIIMDYEGSAEGEGWKVYLDNIYVNWNQFEYASHRSLERFYHELYKFHSTQKGHGALVWANNTQVAAALKFVDDFVWIGIFNFSESNQGVSIQFDNPTLPIKDDDAFILSDPLYSAITGTYGYFTGKELKVSRINSTVSYTDRIKLLKLERTSIKEKYSDFFCDSFNRLCYLSDTGKIYSNFAFSEIVANCKPYEKFSQFIKNYLLTDRLKIDQIELGLKRVIFYLHKHKELSLNEVMECLDNMSSDSDFFKTLSQKLRWHYRKGSIVFMSAEAEPFSKSGGLANVVYELPRELVKLGEEVFVITPMYQNGNFKEKNKMEEAIKKYNITYTGKNVKFKIMDAEYEVGVHCGIVDGIKYYLLDHYEFFNGLYWGITAEEKLRKRIAFARACAEVILTFDLKPRYTVTNDAFAGIFNGIIRCDSYYDNNPIFRECTFVHIIHNGGWQYFDSYYRYENDFDLFNLFNLPSWRAGDFCDPVHGDKLNCMAAGIRFARQSITVSPSYAKQIEIACDGLEHILYNVKGISNAIARDFRQKIEESLERSGFINKFYNRLLTIIDEDTVLKEKINSRYPEILHGKDYIERIADPLRRKVVTRMLRKLLLQVERGIKVDPDLILAVMIHRISEQKGFQLLLEASEGIFKNLGFQLIAGGGIAAGDNRGEAIAHGLYLLSQYYPDRVSVSFGFQDVAVPLLSCDYFLMPSLHEPGGISQLEAMAAGAPVIARATGGLRDTIKPVVVSGDNIEGCGFLFTDFTPWAFYDAMSRAAEFFHRSDDYTFSKIRENAEKSVYHWDKPAQEYIETLYELTETIRM